MEYNVFQNNKLLDRLRSVNNWQLYNLLDVFQDDTKNALKIKKEEYLLEGKNPIIDQGQLHIGGYTNINDKLYKNTPSIIFGDHTRIIKYIDFPMFIGADGVKLLKPTLNKNELNVKYSYYFLKSIELPSDGYSRHFKYLKQVIIPVPKITIQNKIVDALDKAQELIDKRKEQIEALDELVKSKFVDMFGDIITNKKNYSVEELEDITSIITDGTHQTPTYSQSGYIFLSSKNVTSGKVNWDDVKYIPEELHFELSKRLEPRINDILLAKNGTTGVAALVDRDCVFDIYVSLALLRLNNDINPVFMLHMINSNGCKYQFNNSLKGIGVPNLHLSAIRKTKVFVPPIELQNEFADFVKQVEELKFKMENSLKELEDNFNVLMQKSFSGELFS